MLQTILELINLPSLTIMVIIEDKMCASISALMWALMKQPMEATTLINYLKSIHQKLHTTFDLFFFCITLSLENKFFNFAGVLLFPPSENHHSNI